MATRLDVMETALRHIGVISSGEAVSAEDVAFVGDVLDSAFAELSAVHEITFPWALDATPQAMLWPMARYLATQVGQHFAIQTERESRAIARIRAQMLPDDRADSRDINGDGIVSDAEAAAAARAAYF